MFSDVGQVIFPHWTTLERCRFEGNKRNVAFQSMPSNVRLALVDCVLGPQSEPMVLSRTVPKEAGKPVLEQGLDDLAVLLCKVTDKRGRPGTGGAGGCRLRRR